MQTFSKSVEMLNKFNWPLWHWHIEVSSICTLKCPRCPRNELPETLVQDQLRLDFFKNSFTKDVIRQIERISFCGDDGDPIYAKEFLEIIQYLKQVKPTMNILIITNGSYKKAEWWKKLVSYLNEHDEIHFSLDGWDQKSNQKYRVNCDWESIITGIKTVVGHAPTITWAGIVFSFNEHNINMMKGMAIGLGMDKFQMTQSTKFGYNYDHYNDSEGKDMYEPSIDNISTQGRFDRRIFHLTNKRVKQDKAIQTNLDHFQSVHATETGIVPLCMIGTKGLYINSQGYFLPCCWVGNRYNFKTYSKFLIDDLNIYKNGIENVLNNDYWEEFFDNFHNLMECKTKCAAHLVNKEYATNW